MKGAYLEKYIDYKVADLFAVDEFLVVESREENKGWNFIQEGVPGIHRCDGTCYRFVELKVWCKCKKVNFMIFNIF